MADWIEEVVQCLLETGKKDPVLAKLIRGTIKKLDQQPGLGTFLVDTLYFYSDPSGKFRVTYNFHPSQKRIEVVSLRILV